MNNPEDDAGGGHWDGPSTVHSLRLATILVVDDHPPNLAALETILAPLGTRLLSAPTRARAAEIVGTEDLALILLDLELPELDVLETAALLKKRERCPVPIVILTAREPTRAEVARGYASGAVDFLFKPIDPNVLRSKVSMFVELYRQRRAAERESLPPRTPSFHGEESSSRVSERLIAAPPADQVAMVEELERAAASHAAAAVENARLYEEATEARHRAEIAELEMRAGEARLRIALESARLGTWDYNPITGEMRWDSRCKALAGLPLEREVDYATFLRGVHPEDRERVDRAVRQSLDPQGDLTLDVEYRTLGIEDGVERWVASRGLGIAEGGRTVRFIGAMLDITAKMRVEADRAELLARERRARASAESASRAKDEFLATVSHELRNPLNAILGWARVLVEERDIDPERMRKGLDVILRNAKAQVQLVEDTLEVSRIVTGKLRLSTGRIDVGAIVEGAVETVRAAAQAKRVTLQFQQGALGSIVADEDRVQQIMWNLLSNAVKFTPPEGRVTVTARRLADAVEMTVADTGEGIDPDFLPYVFDRFRQFDGSTTRRHGGLGLGLAIVRHLAELHGGTVRADSAGRNRGATFTVTLPIFPTSESSSESVTEVAPAPRKEPPDSSRQLAGRTVLVLDDDADMRDLIGMILEDAGARVIVSDSVPSAIARIEERVPDVAVSDLAMPGEDGYAFARRVRELPASVARALPLVAMTAYARAEDRRRVLAAGFDRHVAKPIEPDELVEALAAVIAERRTTSERPPRQRPSP